MFQHRRDLQEYGAELTHQVFRRGRPGPVEIEQQADQVVDDPIMLVATVEAFPDMDMPVLR